MKNPFEQKILEHLEKLDQRINQLENTADAGHTKSHTHQKARSIVMALLKYGTLITLSLISLIIGYWFLPSWHSTLYQIMLLIYSLGIITAGFIKKNKAVRILGYGIYGCTVLLMIVSYKCNHLLHPHTSVALHSLFAALLISFLVLMCLIHVYKKLLSLKETRFGKKILIVFITLLLFVWGAATIILFFDKITAQPSFFMKPFIEYSRAYDTLQRTDITQFLLTVYYMLFAFITFILGIHYKQWLLRFFSGGTAGLSVYSIFLLMTCVRNASYVALSLCLAALLVVLGYLYAKRHKYRISGQSNF